MACVITLVLLHCITHTIQNAKLFDRNTLNGNNVNEGIMHSVIKARGLRHVISAFGMKVERKQKTMAICMEAGCNSFRGLVKEKKLGVPMLRTALKHIITGLHDMHTAGYVHCDFKHDNAILGADGATFYVIDFGSVRRIGTESNVYCTPQFCPPEALDNVEIPTVITPAFDAWSLGATIYYAIYHGGNSGGYLYNNDATTSTMAIKQFFATEFKLPTQCPANFPTDIFELMRGFLNPDTKKRLSITDAYYEWVNGPAITPSPLARIEPHFTYEHKEYQAIRDKMVDAIFEECGDDKAHFALAVNIMDRYAAQSKGKGSPSPSPSASSYTKAVVILARTAIEPDYYTVKEVEVRNAIVDITDALGFNLYTETCDVILQRVLHPAKINYDGLLLAVKRSNGRTNTAITIYNANETAELSDGEILEDEVSDFTHMPMGRPLKRLRRCIGASR